MEEEKIGAVDNDEAIMDEIIDDAEAASASKGNEDALETGSRTETVSKKKEISTPDEKNKTLTTEERISEINKILGDDPKAIEDYIRKFGYHKDPAWQKLLERSKRIQPLDEETQRSLEEFKKITSTPDYIRLSMRQQGYKEDAIDLELKERGFEIADKPDDIVTLVANKGFGIDPNTLSEDNKAIISDVSKIVNTILEYRLGKELPKRLQPIEEKFKLEEQKEGARNILNEIRKLVDKDKVLEFDTDLKPELDKWLDEHPNADQREFKEAQKDIYYALAIERLKTGGKRKETEVRKLSNRPNIKTGINQKLPAKTGDKDTDMDALLDTLGVTD